jgi:hypothetical protein
LDDGPAYVEKKMFGGIGFMLNGNMAVGVNKEDLIVRVGKEDYANALAEPHARPSTSPANPCKAGYTFRPRVMHRMPTCEVGCSAV